MVQEVVHTDSNNSGVMIAVIALIIVVLFLFFGTNVFRGGGVPAPSAPQNESSGSGEGGEGGSIDVNVPDEIDVNTDGNGGQ